ncbi:MAG TPA: transglycosylase SLT domain-containing protein [Acidimicrobiia bacterium]|nr:transglycosylase SLT domain-containing protein [Acidimicrobiia bacterium]
MRFLRALSAALLLMTSMLLVLGEDSPARAQSVDEAEEDAERLRRQAEEADSLLSSTASRRSGIEDELLASMAELGRLNAELSRLSVHLDELRVAVARADTDLGSITDDLTLQAVDAYVRAVSTPAAAVIGTDDAESAIVAATSLESTIGSDQAAVANLTIQRRELERLRQEFLAEEEAVAVVQAELDSETANLEALLAEADAELAAAVATARSADADYRAALDAVDLAQAREAERQRQEDRASSTTTTTTPATTGGEEDPPSTSTTTAPPVSTTPTTAPPPPVQGGQFPPAVERWRPLVTAYFAPAQVDGALAVIRCESYGDPGAYNPYSGASGLFQFLPSTWATVSPRAGFEGASVFDAEANIGTAAWLTDYYSSRGSDPWSAWACRP